MADKENSDEQEISTHFLLKRLRVTLSVITALLLLTAVGVPLCVFFKVDWVLYLIAGLASAGLIAVALLIVFLVRRYGKELADSLQAMDKQLNDFSKGDVKLSSVHHELPTLEKLQEKLNSAIAHYSQYRLAYTSQSADEMLKKRIASGEILPQQEFEDHLYSEVQNNFSFRSALLMIQLLGGDPLPEQAFKDLHERILKSFPGAMVGLSGERTFSVYVYSVDSFLSLETACEKFVSDYKTFEISRYDDFSHVYYCKIGAVVYPYTPVTNLIEDAASALEKSKDVLINMGVRSVYYPHAIVSESNRRIIYLSSIESFENSFRNAHNYPEQIQALKDFTRWFAVTSDFECGGIMLYDAKTSDYQIIMETGKEAGDKAFSLLGERIPEKDINPFYDAALQDLSFSAADSTDLPPKMASYLRNIGIASFYFAAITFAGEKRGFIYLTSSQTRPFFSLITREDLNGYSAMITSLVVSLQSTTSMQESAGLLEALSTRANKYFYTIDRATYKMTYLSPNLMKAFPNAHVGDVCYEVLRSAHTAPCTHCPLTHGADRRIISHISNTESALSVLQYRGVQDNLSTILIESGNEGENASLVGNHLIDEMLLIKNAQALSLDVSRQIKLGVVGYVISLKLLDADSLLFQLPGSDANSLMNAVSKTVQDAGYGDILYRYDNFELSFLLKSYTKVRITDFVEEIAQELSDSMVVKDVSFKPSFAFSAIAYPADADNAKGLLSLIGKELDRSESFGEGYLVEVENRKPRKALRYDYILDLLNETLQKDEIPVVIQPVIDTKSRKPIGGDILTRLYDGNGNPISSSEFIPIARSHKLLGKVDLGALRAAGALYENYADSYFRSEGITSLSCYVSLESLESPSFLEDIKKVLNRYHFPKGFLTLCLDIGDIKNGEGYIQSAIANLTSFGINWEAANFVLDKLPLDTLKRLGISRIKLARGVVQEAISTPSDYANFSRFVDAAIRGGYVISSTGVEKEEQFDFLSHLEVQRIQGYLFAKPQLEKDFITYLTYGQ